MTSCALTASAGPGSYRAYHGVVSPPRRAPGVSLTYAVIAAACGSNVLAAWPGISSPPRSVIGLGLIDRARIAATPAVVSPTAAEGTVAASPFAAEGTEALSHRPPPKHRAEGTPSPVPWWSARAGLFPGPLPGPPPGPGVAATATSTATPAVVSPPPPRARCVISISVESSVGLPEVLANFEHPSAALRCALLASAHGA